MKTNTTSLTPGDYLCELLDMKLIADGKAGHDLLTTVRVLDGRHADSTVWTLRRLSDPDSAEQSRREWKLLGIPAGNEEEFEEMKFLAEGKRLIVRFSAGPNGFARHHILDIQGVDWPLEDLYPDETEWLDANGFLVSQPQDIAC